MGFPETALLNAILYIIEAMRLVDLMEERAQKAS